MTAVAKYLRISTKILMLQPGKWYQPTVPTSYGLRSYTLGNLSSGSIDTPTGAAVGDKLILICNTVGAVTATGFTAHTHSTAGYRILERTRQAGDGSSYSVTGLSSTAVLLCTYGYDYLHMDGISDSDPLNNGQTWWFLADNRDYGSGVITVSVLHTYGFSMAPPGGSGWDALVNGVFYMQQSGLDEFPVRNDDNSGASCSSGCLYIEGI